MNLSPRSRRFVLWVAHLAMLAYLFQVMAFDHWHSDPSHIVGMPESNAHVMHCHGAASGCADGATVTPAIDPQAVIPLPPPAERAPPASTTTHLTGVFVPTPHQPPRVAA